MFETGEGVEREMGDREQVPATKRTLPGMFSTDKKARLFFTLCLAANGVLILLGLALWKWAEGR